MVGELGRPMKVAVIVDGDSRGMVLLFLIDLRKRVPTFVKSPYVLGRCRLGSC